MELWDLYNDKRERTGRTIQRGIPLNSGEYHLVVFAIIMNTNGEVLITKRTPNKTFPLHWEITGGAALSGDDSETAVLREIQEEIGLSFKFGEGKCIKTFVQKSDFSYFGDIWLFQKEVDLSEITFQAEEVCDVRLASKADLEALIQEGRFVKNDNVIGAILEVLNL